jgi:hypothetical protein
MGWVQDDRRSGAITISKKRISRWIMARKLDVAREWGCITGERRNSCQERDNVEIRWIGGALEPGEERRINGIEGLNHCWILKMGTRDIGRCELLDGFGNSEAGIQGRGWIGKEFENPGKEGHRNGALPGKDKGRIGGCQVK